MPKQPESNDTEFNLEQQEVPETISAALQTVKIKKLPVAKRTTKPSAGGGEPQVISYRHPDKRKNNPHVGLVRLALLQFVKLVRLAVLTLVLTHLQQ